MAKQIDAHVQLLFNLVRFGLFILLFFFFFLSSRCFRYLLFFFSVSVSVWFICSYDYYYSNCFFSLLLLLILWEEKKTHLFIFFLYFILVDFSVCVLSVCLFFSLPVSYLATRTWFWFNINKNLFQFDKKRRGTKDLFQFSSWHMKKKNNEKKNAYLNLSNNNRHKNQPYTTEQSFSLRIFFDWLND